MSFEVKLPEKEKKICDIRWFPEKNSSRVISPVLSPFSYSKTILERISGMSSTQVIEFIQGDSVVFSTTVKNVRLMLGHVSTVLNSVNGSALTGIEITKLMYTAPWEFWKSKEVQKIIERLIP